MLARGADDASIIIRFPLRETFARSVAVPVVFVLLSVFCVCVCVCVSFLKVLWSHAWKEITVLVSQLAARIPFPSLGFPQSLQVTAHTQQPFLATFSPFSIPKERSESKKHWKESSME